ncbi:MAG: hypothetical protein HXY46_05500 [Syntrophaceae bacterium]|nr:hypothetical protein [Syntrophaceae bacterium]
MEVEFNKPFIYGNKVYTIYSSNSGFAQYVADGSRVWIVTDKSNAKKFKESYPVALMGYFDGSFANFRRFPSDASMYLLLWDPKSPGEKGIDIPIE